MLYANSMSMGINACTIVANLSDYLYQSLISSLDTMVRRKLKCRISQFIICLLLKASV